MQIQNASTIREIRKAAGLSLSEGFPQQLAGSVGMVIDVNPKKFRVANIVRNAFSGSTGDATVYTTPTDRDFYLMGLTMACSYSSAADSNFTKAIITPFELTSQLIAVIAKESLTAITANLVFNFAIPIKLQRGSSIIVTDTYSVGSGSKSLSIYGYTVEPFEDA